MFFIILVILLQMFVVKILKGKLIYINWFYILVNGISICIQFFFLLVFVFIYLDLLENLFVVYMVVFIFIVLWEFSSLIILWWVFFFFEMIEVMLLRVL